MKWVLVLALCATAGWAAEPATKPNTVDPEAYRAAMERLHAKSAGTSETRAERLERENRELRETVASLKEQIQQLTQKIAELTPAPAKGNGNFRKGMTYAQVEKLMGCPASNILRDSGEIKAATWRFLDDIDATPIGIFHKEDKKEFTFRFDNGKVESWQEYGR